MSAGELGRIFLAGHRGMVGSALHRRLRAEGVPEADLLTFCRAELDLTDQAAVRAAFARTRPDTVILAAARVGGILANDTYPADFLYDNLMIEANVIHAAHAAANHNGALYPTRTCDIGTRVIACRPC